MKPPDIIEITFKVVKIFEKFNIGYYIGGSLERRLYIIKLLSAFSNFSRLN